ncbi:MAG: phage portal protein [Candidatus Puniceispirillaceae bacterium]
MGIFDFFKGKPQPRKAVRAFHGADTGRLFSDFVSSSRSADSEIKPSLRVLRDRCREISRNHPYAKRYLQIMSTNVVGANGVRIQVRKRNDDNSLDSVGNRIIEQAWQQWGRAGFCTVDGRVSWVQAQRLFMETLARDGEVLIQKIKNPAGNPFGFSLKFLEADYLDEGYDARLSNGNEVRMGVELDRRTGKPLNYYLFEDHPHHDQGYGSKTKRHHKIVPASEIIHCYLQDRAGQTRGVPWMSNVLTRLKMLDGYEEATLVNARVAASKMGFFTSPEGDGFVGDDYDNHAPIMSAEPATFTQLPAGMSFTAFDPQNPTDSFAEFEKGILRGIASGLGVSYVSLANNLEGVSYSSIRQGTIEDRDHFKMVQQFMIDQFIDPVYRAWLEMAITVGRVNLPMGKYDLFADQVIYRPRGFAWVDPAKEINASVTALNNGIVSLQDVHSQYGRDTEEIFEQINREAELADRYGIDTAFQPFGTKLPAQPSIDVGQDDGDV